MAIKIIRALLLGICVGVLGYFILKDYTAALFLGGVWFLAMMIPKKQG